MGGEHACVQASTWSSCGSSPRGRGTRRAERLRHSGRRFIPAWAGNTRAGPTRSGRCPVHPRVGGEHIKIEQMGVQSYGSSPRGRGTHLARYRGKSVRRFIPAWAGNTNRSQAKAPAAPVHPRVGGEHLVSDIVCPLRCGSSPRGRGTRGVFLARVVAHRFIPAWAGNTAAGFSAPITMSVHPRVGGEH